MNRLECVPCGNRAFSNREALQQHLMTSSAYHPLCEKCDMRFSSDLALEAHTADRHPPTFDCDWCSRSFRYLFSLEDHYKGSPYHPNCAGCGRGFKDVLELEEHRQTDHIEGPCTPSGGELAHEEQDPLEWKYGEYGEHFICTECQSGFADEELLRAHANLEHFPSPPPPPKTPLFEPSVVFSPRRPEVPANNAVPTSPTTTVSHAHSDGMAAKAGLRASHEPFPSWMLSLQGKTADTPVKRKPRSHQPLVQPEPQLPDATNRYNELEKQYNQLLQAYEEIKIQPRKSIEPHRIVVLIDGDGALFNFDLIEQGQIGGFKAAAQIVERVRWYTDADRRDEIWIHVFLNKTGLKTLFHRHAKALAAKALDNFVIGMNESAKTIMVVDVGQKKEAADSKIKALLESEVRLLETRMVFFAGSHDNGYVTELRAHVTAGYKEKLVLVPSYTEVASGYKELDLATLHIPNLFMPEKLPRYS
ncbi:hypothetical protein BKA70DRAFT_1307842 [Coprinopsis sp. MPI-PUGE-AT-0042]|nr:hypothetical protein BKA70DRAFT_1307842 [Coprinopsis sp. MPI-PUGE-AT-0042]